MHAIPFVWAQARYVAVIHENVTARVTTQIRQQELESLFIDSTRIAKLGGWRLDRKSGLIICTETLLELLDLSPRARLTWPVIKSMISRGSAQVLIGAVHRAFKRGAGFDVQFQIETATGKWIWVRCAGEARRRFSDITGLSGILQDVSASVRSDIALDMERKRLELAMQISRQALFEIDIPSGDIFWDARAFEIHGQNPSAFTPNLRTLDSLLIPEDQGLTDRVQAFFESERRIWHEQYRIKTPDDGIHYIETLGTILRTDRPRIIGIARDITARREIQLELVQAREAAEAATRAKSRFLANMSHDIRTPMTGILGFIKLLQNSGLNQDQQSYADMAASAAGSLRTILDDILDFSRIESGMLRLEKIPVNVADLLSECTGLFRLSAMEKGVELVYDLAPETPAFILGDPVRLKQILNNLIGNAVKFTEKGRI
ncbi:MAG TPA: histidine kinase dimerization/phospho-acceptor domain-containing protein [Leptospiraceae bacterium]|nr:histidine kinase dimerization/phospho-acceptor domain-containing protein [Leptospiraceae bacterium]